MSLFRTHDVVRVAGGPWLRAQLKKVGAVTGLVFLAGLNAACSGEIKIENGEIPDQYLPAVEAYLGDYPGHFNHFPGSLKLELDGARLLVSFWDQEAEQDLLDPRCGSQIGLLKSVRIKDIDGQAQVRWADFEFDPGSCSRQVLGRRFTLEMDEQRGRVILYADILREYKNVQRCEWERNPNDVPRYICRTYREPVLISGSFSRSKPETR